MKKRYAHNLGFLSLIVGISVAWTVPSVAAAHDGHHEQETSVQSNTSVSASTGGNTAEGGEVIEGKSTGSVYVETVVDGESMESFQKTFEGVFSFDEVFENESDNAQTQTEVNVHTSGEEKESFDAQQVENETAQKKANMPQNSHNVAETSANNASGTQHTIQTASQEQASDTTEVGQYSSETQSSFSIKTFLGNLFHYVFNIFK